MSFMKKIVTRKPFCHAMEMWATKVLNEVNIVAEWDMGGSGLVRYKGLMGNGNFTLVNKILQALSDVNSL